MKSAAPTGYFEDAAIVAARNMRFLPGKIRGQPVNTVVLLPFVFHLR
ncbi:MAG: energy transducer TonB [Desulfovibrio sp.]|nr:energy transducer TonB [Desulfovibrio sp.]